MSGLQVYFLGTLDIHHDDRQLPKPATLKSQSLLAYLILHRDQPQPRDRLAGLFWGDRPERKARRSLTTALWHIHRCLPDDGLILSDLHTVQFDPCTALWLDVDEFRSLASVDDIVSLQSAVELFRGDFLDGFYDDWIINERYRLEALYLKALARLAAGREREGNHEKALSAALRLPDHDLLREDAHRAAMRVYCRLGRRSAALSQYERCRAWAGVGAANAHAAQQDVSGGYGVQLLHVSQESASSTPLVQLSAPMAAIGRLPLLLSSRVIGGQLKNCRLFVCPRRPGGHRNDVGGHQRLSKHSLPSGCI